MQEMQEATTGGRAKSTTTKRTSDREGAADAASSGGARAVRDGLTGGSKEARRTQFDRGATEGMDVAAAGASRQILCAWEVSEDEVASARPGLSPDPHTT